MFACGTRAQMGSLTSCSYSCILSAVLHFSWKIPDTDHPLGRHREKIVSVILVQNLNEQYERHNYSNVEITFTKYERIMTISTTNVNDNSIPARIPRVNSEVLARE